MTRERAARGCIMLITVRVAAVLAATVLPWLSTTAVAGKAPGAGAAGRTVVTVPGLPHVVRWRQHII